VYEITATDNLHGGGDLFIKNASGSGIKCYTRDWNDLRKYSSVIMERESLNFEEDLDPYKALQVGSHRQFRSGDTIKILYSTVSMPTAGDIIQIEEDPDHEITGSDLLFKYLNKIKDNPERKYGRWVVDHWFADPKNKWELLSSFNESLNFEEDLDPYDALKIGKHRQFNVGDQLIFLEKLSAGNEKYEWKKATYFFSINNFKLYTIERMTDKKIFFTDQSGRDFHIFNIEWFANNPELWKQIFETNESLGFEEDIDPYKALSVGKYSDPNHLEKEEDKIEIESMKAKYKALRGYNGNADNPNGYGTVKEMRDYWKSQIKTLQNKFKTDAEIKIAIAKKRVLQKKQGERMYAKQKLNKTKSSSSHLTARQHAINDILSLQYQRSWATTKDFFTREKIRDHKKYDELSDKINIIKSNFNIKSKELRKQKTNESLGFEEDMDPYKALSVGKYSDPEYLKQKEKDERNLESIRSQLRNLTGFHPGDDYYSGESVRELRNRLNYQKSIIIKKYETEAQQKKKDITRHKANKKRLAKQDAKEKIADDKLKTLTPKQIAINAVVDLQYDRTHTTTQDYFTRKKTRNHKEYNRLTDEMNKIKSEFGIKSHDLRNQKEYDPNYDDTLSKKDLIDMWFKEWAPNVDYSITDELEVTVNDNLNLKDSNVPNLPRASKFIINGSLNIRWTNISFWDYEQSWLDVKGKIYK